jgi:hypothetical protein
MSTKGPFKIRIALNIYSPTLKSSIIGVKTLEVWTSQLLLKWKLIPPETVLFTAAIIQSRRNKLTDLH